MNRGGKGKKMNHINLRRTVSVFAFAMALVTGAFAQTPPVLPPPGGGTGGGDGSVTSTTEVTILGTIADHNEGCCPNPIPCPAPTGTTVPSSQVVTKYTSTIEQTQTMSLTLTNLFNVLTNALGFSTNKVKKVIQEETATVNTPSKVVNCGSQFKVVKTRSYTTTVETRSYTDSGGATETKPRYRYDETIGFKSRTFGSLQSWDPITDVVTGGPCPPVMATPCEVEDQNNF